MPAGLLSTKFFSSSGFILSRLYSQAASLRVTGSVTLVPFEIGTPLWSSNDRLHWKKVPAGLEGAKFTQFDSQYKGATEFVVESSGTVFLAVTSRWGSGGNHSGSWTEELTSKEAFLDQGWKEISPLHETSDEIGHQHQWILYSRDCHAGEHFRLRTEKYCAPILFQVAR